MKKILLTVLLFLAIPLHAFAGEMTIAAAANLQFVLEELKAEFTEETGIKVQSVLGSSGKLTTQIENGAPLDIFMSADMDYPNTLFKEGLAVDKPRAYAQGVLVLWTMNELDLSKGTAILNDPTVKKIAIASPKTAPYGRQAVNALKGQGLYAGIQYKLVYGENIAQANQFISTRSADIGFTAKSVVVAANMAGKGKWVEVPDKDYEPILQGVVVLKHSGASADAQKFYDFIFSEPAKVIFRDNGYRDVP